MLTSPRHAALIAGLLATWSNVAAAADPEPIYGGAKVAPCAWPTTVALDGCTGTLVHPEVVVFAAHCMEGGYGPSAVTFGDNEYAPAFKVGTTACKSNPKYGSSPGHDVAYCKLTKPVTSIPIVPILMGCETQVLVPGVEVVAAGFGQANDNLGWGPKRAVAMKLNSVQSGEAFIGGNGKDTCYGDSGGPVFVRLQDGSWRVFGITSYGDYCGGGGYYSMMHTDIDWLEQSSGIDLTPCHDHGAWAPTSACGGFPTDPDVGGGSWANGCAGQSSGPSATCGAAFDGSGTGGAPNGGGGSGGGAPPPGTGATGGSAAGGSGATSAGGTSGANGHPGCSSDPDCSSCADCVSRCICLTGATDACQSACAPYENPPGVGGGGSGNGAAPEPYDPKTSSGCAVSSNPSPSTPSLLWAFALLLAARSRRIHRGDQ